MLPERDVREILRRESGAEGRRPPSSRTKDQKMARAVSLRTQTGGDWYSPYDMSSSKEFVVVDCAGRGEKERKLHVNGNMHPLH